MRSKVIVGGLTATAVVLVMTAAAGARPGVRAAAAPVARAATTDNAARVRTVTLITGDRVVVQSQGKVDRLVRIDRGPGRAHVPFAAAQAVGHLYVFPGDALPLLRADRVDRRLFDVSQLLTFGYDDDRRADLPLIVTGRQAASVRSLTSHATVAAGAMRAVPGGSALRPAKSTVGKFWQALTATAGMSAATAPKVWLDGIRHIALDQSVPQIGAPSAWAAGFTGAGVTVGVVDSGIDSSHPDLTGQVIAAQDFTGTGDTRDFAGHGTHVAATIASHDTRYRGVAFGAHLISAKVCGGDGSCFDSAVLAGMQWAAQQGARVINMSLGGGDSPSVDPLEQAVADLTAQYGVLFVIAAGNAGPGDFSVGSPGSADAALTVGAVDKQNVLADFSSRGPRVGDEAIKPDITAPGVDIVAACGADSGLCAPGDLHVALSGTSMATPHVTGSAALLVQEHPTWTPAQLKAALMGTALRDTTLDPFAQGAGRVDVAHVIGDGILADPPSESFGKVAFPHNDDTPLVRPITYRNLSATDETLQLSLATDAPAGMFSLSATSVTVPAGGSASVNLTADTNLDVPDARYTGYLLAHSADASVDTPFAVDKAPEQHDVTLHYINRDGQPADNVFSVLINPATGDLFFATENGQSVSVTPGEYVLSSEVIPDDFSSISLMTEPKVEVTKDLDLTVDARRARPVTVSLPFAGAQKNFLVAAAATAVPGGDVTALADGDATTDVFSGSMDPSLTSPNVHGLVVGIYSLPTRTGTTEPATAALAWHLTGRGFNGLVRNVRRDDLATFRVSYGTQGMPAALINNAPVWSDWAGSLAPGTFLDQPGSRVEYLNTDERVSWARFLTELTADFSLAPNELISDVTRFEGGQVYTEARNFGVFAPGFAQSSLEGIPLFSRKGDVLNVTPTVIDDRQGWRQFSAFPPTRPTITVLRNGVEVGSDLGTGPLRVAVDPGPADFQVKLDTLRDAPNTLSTAIHCVWSFRSDTTPAGTWSALPLSAVRFRPELDANNAAPAGGMAIPIDIDRQPGSTAATTRTLTVQASFDDGATWQAVPVHGSGQHWTATLTNPAAGFVSLRASAVDGAGNTVSVTVIRAYGIA